VIDWLRRSANRDVGDMTVNCGTVTGQVAICGMAPTQFYVDFIIL
jgi:hypothetical protein